MGDPFTALTKRPAVQASHDPQVARRKKAREEKNLEEERHEEWRRLLVEEIYGRQP